MTVWVDTGQTETHKLYLNFEMHFKNVEIFAVEYTLITNFATYYVGLYPVFIALFEL